MDVNGQLFCALAALTPSEKASVPIEYEVASTSELVWHFREKEKLGIAGNQTTVPLSMA
jgi:hypothetical protein